MANEVIYKMTDEGYIAATSRPEKVAVKTQQPAKGDELAAPEFGAGGFLSNIPSWMLWSGVLGTALLIGKQIKG